MAGTMTGGGFLISGRCRETVRPAARVAAICLLTVAGCGCSQESACRVDAAAATGSANVDAASVGDTNADLPIAVDGAVGGETAQLCDSTLVWKGDYVIASLADLDRLRGYTSLSGALVVDSDELVNLHGLECLHTVDGSVEIGRCPLRST
jgi:hypothetical protein